MLPCAWSIRAGIASAGCIGRRLHWRFRCLSCRPHGADHGKTATSVWTRPWRSQGHDWRPASTTSAGNHQRQGRMTDASSSALLLLLLLGLQPASCAQPIPLCQVGAQSLCRRLAYAAACLSGPCHGDQRRFIGSVALCE